jgi:hypothetical protein
VSIDTSRLTQGSDAGEAEEEEEAEAEDRDDVEEDDDAADRAVSAACDMTGLQPGYLFDHTQKT